MSERTPKTATVRTAWVKGHPFPLTTDPEERDAEFNRWLAEHDREVAERAWDEGMVYGVNYDAGDYEVAPEPIENPYREGGAS